MVSHAFAPCPARRSLGVQTAPCPDRGSHEQENDYLLEEALESDLTGNIIARYAFIYKYFKCTA